MELQIPEEVWLIGKGPSLDTYDWSKAGWFRACINETAFLIPNCTMAFCLDYRIHDKFIAALPENVLVVVKKAHLHYHRYPYMLTYETQGVDIVQAYATATVAIEILAQLGAKTIHFVGFDSIDNIGGYAQSVIGIRGEGTNKHEYQDINKRIYQVLKTIDINCIWEHRNETNSIINNSVSA